MKFSKVADREHDIADPQGVGTAHGHGRQFADREMQHGKIGIGILTHDARVRDSAVGDLHLDGIRTRDHMLIRDDRA